jgi:hypothetical protein
MFSTTARCVKFSAFGVTWRGAALERAQELAYLFRGEGGQDIALNGRLPRITQSDVSPSGRLE